MRRGFVASCRIESLAGARDVAVGAGGMLFFTTGSGTVLRIDPTTYDPGTPAANQKVVGLGAVSDDSDIATAPSGEVFAAETSIAGSRIIPSYTEAMPTLANIYESTGDFERSREVAQRASELAKSSDGALDATTRGKLANLQADVADAYAEAGELREAIDGYRKALDRCPTFHDIRFRLGVALRDAGLPDRALREFARILRAQPDYIEARVQRGLTLYTLGRTEDALAEWESVLEAEPSCDDAKMYLRLVRATGKPTS